MSFVALVRAFSSEVAQDTATARRAPPASGLVNFAESMGRASAGYTTRGASYAPEADVALHSRAMRMVNEQRTSYADALRACQVGDVRFAEAESTSATLVDRARVILQAGTRTSDDGQTFVFSRRDLEATAAAYDPRQREAPLTLGKPVHDAPAYGWVRALKVTGDGQLVMVVRDLYPGFADMVNQRRFATRAVAFYGPNHPNNPSPGAWYLRHIAYMGAQGFTPLKLKHA